MMPQAASEEKIQHYYDNLWSVGKKFNKKFLDSGFHFGYYEKGVVNYRQALQNMNKYIGNLLDLGNGQPLQILEAGCGIGATSRLLAKQHPECRFIGISLGKEEIEIAKKLQKEQHLTNMQFFTGNYNNTGFENNSFDRVFALESLVYAVNKTDAVREISRVLKPQGKFVIMDGFFLKNPPSNSFLKNAYAILLAKRSIPGIITLQEIQAYLKAASFEQIVIHDLSKNISKHYVFGGFFISLQGLFSAEIKRIKTRWKKEPNQDTDKIIGGAGFMEMLLGLTKTLGYYAVVATKT